MVQCWHTKLMDMLLKQNPPYKSQEVASFRLEQPPSLGKTSGVTWPILFCQEEVYHNSPLSPGRHFHQKDRGDSNEEDGLSTFSTPPARVPEAPEDTKHSSHECSSCWTEEMQGCISSEDDGYVLLVCERSSHPPADTNEHSSHAKEDTRARMGREECVRVLLARERNIQ